MSTSGHLPYDGLCDVLSGSVLWRRQQKTHTQDTHRRHTHWTASTSGHLPYDGLCDVLSGAFLWHRQQKTHIRHTHLTASTSGHLPYGGLCDVLSGSVLWRRQQKTHTQDTHTGQRPPLAIRLMTVCAMSCREPFHGVDSRRHTLDSVHLWPSAG